MARARNPNRDRALEIYIQNKGNIKISKIAETLKEKPKTVSGWKSKDNWDEKIPRVGAPKGNKNAKGSKGNKSAKGAPKGNLNAFKHGRNVSNERILENIDEIYPKKIKYFSKKTKDQYILDILYRNIKALDLKIVDAYNMLEVEGKHDHTVDSALESGVLFATDKEVKSCMAISQMITSLTKSIKEYEELVNKNRDLETEEQKARIKKIKQDTSYLKVRTEVEKSKLVNNEKGKEDKIDEFFAKLEESITNVN
jgi:hypothetical protein